MDSILRRTVDGETPNSSAISRVVRPSSSSFSSRSSSAVSHGPRPPFAGSFSYLQTLERRPIASSAATRIRSASWSRSTPAGHLDTFGFLLPKALLKDEEGVGGEDDQETLPGSTDS
jgi:hypothetical protein